MGNGAFHNDIFLSYYGDDFTGSTDVMESLALNGIPTALFLEPPTRQEVERFQLKVGVGAREGDFKLRAFGVAGLARSWNPARMEAELPAIFEKISRVPADFFQYKVCSTFDSAPEVGNIGCAAEIALRYFPSDYIPLLVGAPFLSRYLLFGNLFARVDQTTYRLDRHPTMSKHPVTPMSESDLKRHLAKQTERKIELLDIFGLDGQYGPPATVFRELIKKKGRFLLFDTLTEEHLYTIGRLLVDHNSKGGQLIVSSSGADYALAFHLQKMGWVEPVAKPPGAGKAECMVVVAGSCSPVTAGQIDYMESLGHQGIRMDSLQLLQPTKRDEVIKDAVAQASVTLRAGKVPMLYTARGPEDPYYLRTKQWLLENGDAERGITVHLLAEAQGQVLTQLIHQHGKMRVVVAGGDTSGYVSRTLGIYALETLCPIAPGAPLCVAHSTDKLFDGLEILLKGGQNGDHRFFAYVLEGGIPV